MTDHDPRLRHRPADPALLRREAAALLALGLHVEDVAAAFQMPAPAVAGLLADSPQTEEGR